MKTIQLNDRINFKDSANISYNSGIVTKQLPDNQFLFKSDNDNLCYSSIQYIDKPYLTLEVLSEGVIKTKTQSWYQVAVNSTSWLGVEGYSKYHQRWSLAHKGELVSCEIYGFEQCIEHIAEYYGKQDEYTEGRQKDVLTIEKVTKIIDTIEYTPIAPIKHKRIDFMTIETTD